MDDICFTREDVSTFVKENKIEFISLWFTDIQGNTKSYEIDANILDKAMTNGMTFDGSSISGYQEIHESDLIAMPDPKTFRVIPWSPNCARLICDIFHPDFTQFEGDPRHVLKRILKKADAMGFKFLVGPELEYFYFKNNRGTEFVDRGGYFDLAPLDLALDLRRKTVEALEKFGVVVDYTHHEVAPSQHEVCLRYEEALEKADQIQTYKLVVKEIANQNGCYATFMPKPVMGHNGSGMHTHMSLFDKEGGNVFYAPNESMYDMSETGQMFIAGILKYAREFTAITNPIVNSYKRLVPGYEAPVYITWAARNRSTMCRMPASKKGDVNGKRIELRSPDPSCNPYLAFTVMLAAGMAGIEEKLKLEPAVEQNLFALTREKVAEMGIQSLPFDLGQALVSFKKSKLMQQALGEHVFKNFIVVKNREWESYSTTVHQWELDRYLARL